MRMSDPLESASTLVVGRELSFIFHDLRLIFRDSHQLHHAGLLIDETPTFGEKIPVFSKLDFQRILNS